MYEPTALAKELMAYLDCPCQVFPPMADDDPILDAYRQARKEGAAAGFTPVLLPVEETLAETLRANAGVQDGTETERIRAWRKALLEGELPDGAAFLRDSLELRRNELRESGFDWEELLGETEDGEEIDGLSAYWNPETEWTDEVILAKIPTANPWEVFAWLPMGGWNECPAAEQMMAAAKHWYEGYGAVPAALSRDVLEFTVPSPVAEEEKARVLALEQYGFCIDRVEQCEESCTIGALTGSLMCSKVWYFWWD